MATAACPRLHLVDSLGCFPIRWTILISNVCGTNENQFSMYVGTNQQLRALKKCNDLKNLATDRKMLACISLVLPACDKPTHRHSNTCASAENKVHAYLALVVPSRKTIWIAKELFRGVLWVDALYSKCRRLSACALRRFALDKTHTCPFLCISSLGVLFSDWTPSCNQKIW
jgi:hypothetical protein